LINMLFLGGSVLSSVDAFGVKTLPRVFAPRVLDVRRTAPLLKLQPPGVKARELLSVSPHR
jgi:hypothetical protein